MDKIKAKVIEFLKTYKIDFEDFSIEEYCSVFLDEMEKGLNNENSSLHMIPTYIEVKDEVPINEKVIVLDAGGTNFRVAVLYFDNNKKPVITNFDKYSMPGSDKEIDTKTFFNSITEYLKKVINESVKIGFCFSYPAEILPNKDGKMLNLTKEVNVKNSRGELLGKNLNDTLSSSGYKKKNIIVLNDTVTTLLAGKAAFSDKIYDSYIGFILGTGTNSCYIEKNNNIKKITEHFNLKEQIINIESGGFNKGPCGIIDKEFDSTTIDPGIYTFEKMISGRYVGQLCYFVIKRASEDGVFSKDFIKKLGTINTLLTVDINNFICYPVNSNNPLGNLVNLNNEDRITLYYLVDRLIERIAKLTVINLASAVLKSGKGKDPSKPVCITAEGTTYYKLKTLKSKVEYYIKDYLINKKNRYVEIINIENATLIGAAIAGLTN